MDLYNDFVGLLGDYLIRGIFISVLVAWAASFMKRIDIGNAKLILKWIMIGYACLAIVNLIILLIHEFYNGVEFGGYSFGYWAFGRYWLSYWVMLTGNVILPFILLSKKIGNRLIFLFIVGVLMNIGWLFESFVVIVTNLHRDYIPGDWGSLDAIPLLPYGNEIYLLRGLILGIVVVGIGNAVNKLFPLKFNNSNGL